MSYNCPKCNAVIYSRRNKTCSTCGTELPAELALSAAEAKALDQEEAQMAAKRHEQQARIDADELARFNPPPMFGPLNFFNHLSLIGQGAGASLLAGIMTFLMLAPHAWTNVSDDSGLARTIDIFEMPVTAAVWILDHLHPHPGSSYGVGWFLLHFAYWILLGALAGWGLSIGWSKIKNVKIF